MTVTHCDKISCLRISSTFNIDIYSNLTKIVTMSEPFIDFDAIFNLALKETEDGMKLGFYISEPCLVTPLESYVNKYPKIAETLQ